MDTKGIIQEHSKIKLELYRLYLERYLAVLLNTRAFDRIVIHDVFAGAGFSENKEKGSALIAAEVINSALTYLNPHNKRILLKLNDSKKKNVSSLKKNLEAFSFKEISNLDANNFIESLSGLRSDHNLFFIDPHGYTQISPSNFLQLFSKENSDYLIFMPIYHIYRFLKPSEKTSQKESDMGDLFEGFECKQNVSKENAAIDRKYFEPILSFLGSLSINEDFIKNVSNVDEFSDIIVSSLKKVSGARYGYKQKIKKSECNSNYCLFFISGHIFGAEKFLEAQEELEKQMKQSSVQQSFVFIEEGRSGSILDYIDYETFYDNVSLYECSIESGISAKKLRAEMRELEKNHRVVIKALPMKSRNRSGLYLDYDHYKNSDRVISIQFSQDLFGSHQKKLAGV